MAASRVSLANTFAVLNEDADLMKKKEKSRKRDEKAASKKSVQEASSTRPIQDDQRHSAHQGRGRWADMSEDEDDFFADSAQTGDMRGQLNSEAATASGYTMVRQGRRNPNLHTQVADAFYTSSSSNDPIVTSETSDDSSQSSNSEDERNECDDVKKLQLADSDMGNRTVKKTKAKVSESSQLSKRDRQQQRQKEIEELEGMLSEMRVTTNVSVESHDAVKPTTPSPDMKADVKKKKKKAPAPVVTNVDPSSESASEEIDKTDVAKRLAKLRAQPNAPKKSTAREEAQRLAASEAKRAKENAKKEKKSKHYYPKTNNFPA